jgi:hypothetical protein
VVAQKDAAIHPPGTENILKIERPYLTQKQAKVPARQSFSADLQQSRRPPFVLQKLKVAGRMCAVNILP